MVVVALLDASAFEGERRVIFDIQEIGGAQMSMGRVKTISLGGAYLESPSRLNVGDSIQLEVRSGMRKIHTTAIVRNLGPDGGGVEFVHMKDEDRERLRRLVHKHL